MSENKKSNDTNTNVKDKKPAGAKNTSGGKGGTSSSGSKKNGREPSVRESSREASRDVKRDTGRDTRRDTSQGSSGSFDRRAKNQPREERRAERPRERHEEEYTQIPESKPSHTFLEQYLPYVWGALGLFLTVCFVLDLICGADSPQTHWMGYLGFYLCRCLYGLFGWTAFLIAPVLFLMAFAWRRYCRQRLVGVQITMSLLFMLLMSAFIHVCVCSSNEYIATVVNPAELYRTGAVWKSGGVIGGLLGWLMFKGLKLAGSLVVMIIALPLIVMFLAGVTPADVGTRLWHFLCDRRERRDQRKQEKREAERERQEAEAAERRRASLAASKAQARARASAQQEEQDRETERRDIPSRRSDTTTAAGAEDAEDQGGDRDEMATFRVNKRTGEVWEDSDAPEPDMPEDEDDRFAEEDFPDEEEEEGPDQNGEDMYVGRVHRGKQERVETRRETTRGEDVRQRPARSASVADTSTADTSAANRSAVETPAEPEKDDLDTLAACVSGSVTVVGAAESAAAMAAEAPVRASHMEIDLEELDGEDPLGELPSMPTSKEKAGTQKQEEVVVRILPSDTSALTGTPDNPVDGLPDERAILPEDAEKGEGASTADPVPEPEIPAYTFPPLDLLARGSTKYEADEDEIAENTAILRDTLESFHIRVRDISCSCGPTVTRYEIKPDVGVRVRSIANLVDDIALSLAKSGVRIEAPIPGKSAVGIEVPNEHPSTVYLRNLLEAPEFQNHKSRIASCLGAEVSGRPVIFDINKMPHMLVCGTTGSGKSVCINCVILSILYKARPDEVKLILIDPKKVEFSVYRDIPHLYCPIVTDPKKAAGALYSAVAEMERRFELIEEVGVRNLAGYNEATAGDPERPPMPQMVIIIDELADLMMTASADVEAAICRLAQKARAAGIHLILGTQRPSVDVVTGLIKANIPSRIAFTVKSQTDSRTVIDVGGAEKLIGRGDMLYAPIGATKPLRVQGAFVSDTEVEDVVTFVKAHNEKPVFDESFTQQMEIEAARCGAGKRKGEEGGADDFDALGGGDGEDPKFWEAVEVAVNSDKVSTSLLQRRTGIGYGRAAKIIDRMEELGFVGPAENNKPRKLLITAQDFAELKMNGLKK